jgi:hypothetical protein
MKLENFRSFTLTNKLKNYNNIKYYYNALNFESDYTEDEATLIITFLTLCNHFISVFYTNLYSFTPSNKNKHFYYQTLFLYKYKQLLTKIDYLIKQEDPVFFQKVKFNIELTKYNTVIDNNNNDYYIDQTIKNKFTLSTPFLTLNSNSIYTFNKLQDQLYLYKIL